MSLKSREIFFEYLDTTFQFCASSLFDVAAIVDGSATDEETLGFCILVLLSCLQSRLKQNFMNAALKLDLDVQSVIFRLVHEPMTQLSTDQQLTRESVLAGFRESVPNHCGGNVITIDPATAHPSTLTIPDVTNSEVTPLKSVVTGKSFREMNESGLMPNVEDRNTELFRKSWPVGMTLESGLVSSSPAKEMGKKLTRLREAEREKRRLMAELEKERTYRDEVENVVAELRNQLDEARKRATEAEARVTRLSRDLAVLQDQADELNLCRTELAVREDEIAKANDTNRIRKYAKDDRVIEGGVERLLLSEHDNPHPTHDKPHCSLDVPTRQ
ncbi:unnamed protein product [Echinostoma caproni]|uniref:RUN domain-containing protein n=1 Tax=Echinostoma caproni TaxID=27848 RepID=A0A183AYK1_9TREM|nr:unnamed protein product [Echinostoma caproni]